MRSWLVILGVFVLSGVAGAGSFSGNGLIAYVRAVGTADVVEVYEPASGASRDLVSGSEPAWAPDGSRLAFVQGETVYVANADGSGASAVGMGSWPSWSPDGTQLAVARYDGVATAAKPRGTLQLNVVDLATLSERQLTSGSEDVLLPAWSPDGSAISYGTTTGLYLFDTAHSTTRQLALPRPPNGGASWSPDGKQLAYLASNGQVWVANVDGSGAHQLTYTLVGGNGPPDRPAWSPNGTRIAWTQNADLCVTDLSGTVRRLTYTQPGTSTVTALLPVWQPTSPGTQEPVAAPFVPNALLSCDWKPGARVELLDAGPTPQDVQVKSPQQLAFVNHTAEALTVTTSIANRQATIAPGDAFALSPAPGSYRYTVSGYPDGPRQGTFYAAAAGTVTIDQHAAIRYGQRTLLTGTAQGPGGTPVVISARPLSASHPTQITKVTPVRGTWRLTVSPRVGTQYTATFAGAQDQRILSVLTYLRVAEVGHTVTATFRPNSVPGPVLLFRLTPNALMLWSEVRSTPANPNGVAFRNVPKGRYYVAILGGRLYLDTASDPFTIGR